MGTPERYPWCCFGAFINNFENILDIVLVFTLLNLNMQM